MEKIGNQRIWSYFDDSGTKAQPAANLTIRSGPGHTVHTYFELTRKVAELQFLNRDYFLLFRGQSEDYRTAKGHSTLKATLFRPNGARMPTHSTLAARFHRLRAAEDGLVERYVRAKFLGRERLRRHRVLRWAILQHYEVCSTPLFDVTHSLRIAASFGSRDANRADGYVFVFGVPHIGGAVTASAEAGLQIIRLSSACPPEAVRPHLQQGFLLGEYPEVSDITTDAPYLHYEMDFGRRLVAKFRLNLKAFWHSENFPRATEGALYPKDHRDPLLGVTRELIATLAPSKG